MIAPVFSYTPRQRDIMQFIAKYREITGSSPTLEEIGDAYGIHRVTIHQHIGALLAKGAVAKLPQRSRSIVPLDPAYLPKPECCPNCGHDLTG